MTTSTADLTSQTPAEIDAQLFPILDKLGAQQQYLDGVQRQLNGDPDKYGRPARPLGDFERRELTKHADGYEAKIAELEEQASPFEAEYAVRPWTRYIVVPGGHLHKRGCHTLTPGRTMVGQNAEASGLGEEEVIAKFDEAACTHCFPNAPVAAKLTPAEEGFCEHSGEFAPAEKLPEGWMSRHYMPSVRCECGHVGSITTTGKFRKHKPGRKD